MSKITLTYPPGATPLDPNEIGGLIPDYITTQGELNTLEQQNIADAIDWVHRKSHDDILNVTFAFELHKRMLGRVWKWAGEMRRSNKNIGVLKDQIMNQLGALFGDVGYWIKNSTYNWDETGARFHHRLVSIHAFANGNGRHARLMTDILLEINGQKPFSWGMNANADPIETESTTRNSYVSALKAADAGDFKPLIQFVRS